MDLVVCANPTHFTLHCRMYLQNAFNHFMPVCTHHSRIASPPPHLRSPSAPPIPHGMFYPRVGECFFWYWLAWVVPDKGPLIGCCVRVLLITVFVNKLLLFKSTPKIHILWVIFICTRPSNITANYFYRIPRSVMEPTYNAHGTAWRTDWEPLP